jgi:hypothetical protein
MHVDAWFLDSGAKEFRAGLLGGCGESWGREGPPSLIDRIQKAAVLLRPGEHFDGTLALDGAFFKLPPGSYKIVAKLNGWKDDQFSPDERTQLRSSPVPFLGGEATASTPVTITR